MARYKGRLGPKQIEREDPYFVDVPIPEGGLGRRLDAMHEWHLARGLQARQGSAGLWTARFCFADVTSAEAFKAEFGRDLQIPPMPKDDPLALIEWAKREVARRVSMMAAWPLVMEYKLHIHTLAVLAQAGEPLRRAMDIVLRIRRYKAEEDADLVRVR